MGGAGPSGKTQAKKPEQKAVVRNLGQNEQEGKGEGGAGADVLLGTGARGPVDVATGEGEE